MGCVQSQAQELIFIESTLASIPESVKAYWIADDSVIESTLRIMFQCAQRMRPFDVADWDGLKVQPRMVLPYISKKYTNVYMFWS